MIRPLTLITMLLAASSGAYLFAVKHRAQVLDDQLAATTQQSRLDGQRIRVLQAQWALEIDPSRLGQLAAQFTTLQPMQPAQLVSLASLREDLPPPGGAAPGLNPENDAPPFVAAAANAAATPVAAGLPLPPDLPPDWRLAGPRLASAAPPPALRAAHLVSHSALHMAATHFVETLPAPRPFRAASQNVTPPLAAQLVSVKVASAPVVETVPTASSGASVSALGMAADLAAPQPLPGNGSIN